MKVVISGMDQVSFGAANTSVLPARGSSVNTTTTTHDDKMGYSCASSLCFGQQPLCAAL